LADPEDDAALATAARSSSVCLDGELLIGGCFVRILGTVVIDGLAGDVGLSSSSTSGGGPGGGGGGGLRARPSDSSVILPTLGFHVADILFLPFRSGGLGGTAGGVFGGAAFTGSFSGKDFAVVAIEEEDEAT